jgi:protein TonB
VAPSRIRIVARLEGVPSELLPYVVVSVAVHVAFAAALVLMPSLRHRSAIPDDPIVVDLVAGPRTAARVPATPAAPAAPPRSAQLAPSEPPKVTPVPEEPTPEPVPVPEEPAPAPPTDASDPGGEPGSGIVGELGGGGTGGALDSGDAPLGWYRDSITAAFRSHWQRPILTGRVDVIEVRVAFEILRDGAVRDLRVEESSGVATFDRAALRAIRDASPLPPLPLAWREPTLPAVWVFRMFPE